MKMIEEKKVFETWFSCLGNDIGIDLFNYDYSFNDYLRDSFNVNDTRIIKERIDSLEDKRHNFFIENEYKSLTTKQFMEKYEDIVKDKGYSGLSGGNWNYSINNIKNKLVQSKDFSLDTETGEINVVLLSTGYIDSKYNPERLNGILETRLTEEDEGILKEAYFNKLIKKDFSFFPTGSDLEELVVKFNNAINNIQNMLNSEMDNLKKLYSFGKFNRIVIEKKLNYMEEVIKLVNPYISKYNNEVRTRIKKEKDKFLSKDQGALRKKPSKEDVDALFLYRTDKENEPIIYVSNPVISISSRIKQELRFIRKQGYKSIINSRKFKVHRCHKNYLKIDDMVGSDNMGIMAVINPNHNLAEVTAPFYKTPYWITVEDDPKEDKEGHTRQTKLIHTAKGVVLDFHERDPYGLFFFHFGRNSQLHFEKQKERKLTPKERNIRKAYRKELEDLYSKGFNFKGSS